MDKPRPVLPSKMIEGLLMPEAFSEDCFKKALKYQPRDDDVFLVTYPKCGTTWTQQILLLLLNKGRPAESFLEFNARVPFLEMAGPESATNMPRPGAIKIHLPFHMAPYSPRAKYIYVTRNPKDCCVSYYYHNKNLNETGHSFQGNFDDFFELFVTGEVDYGDYFDHLLGWYAHRNDPNLLFLVYEQMKMDPRTHLLKIAEFLGKEYLDMLENDEKLLQSILHLSSIDFMKVSINTMLDDLFKMTPEEVANDPLMPEGIKHILEITQKQQNPQAKPQANTFVRKGIVGDWKNHFSSEQIARMDKRTLEKTTGSDVMDLWKNVEGI